MTYVRQVQAHGLHGRFDIELDLKPGINVIFGRNGSGKTTLLHILANILNGSFERFAFLQFRDIKVSIGDEHSIELQRTPTAEGDVISVYLNGVSLDVVDVRSVQVRERTRDSASSTIASKEVLERSKALADKLPLRRAAYFPAFRTMVEAWSDETRSEYRDDYNTSSEYYRVHRETKVTRYARELFGKFVPTLSYPSPMEIELELTGKIRSAAYTVATKGQAILSDAFLDVFAALSDKGVTATQTPDRIVEDIGTLLEQLDRPQEVDSETSREDVYVRLRNMMPSLKARELSDTAARVLGVYRKALTERLSAQSETYEPIERYVNSVNEFLEGKKMAFKRSSVRNRRTLVSMRFEDNSEVSLQALSSGERQIVSMLYAATYMSQRGNVVLIDEPELSLHVDWQRLLLQKMSQQLGQRQIIVCTHAPEIAADYEDKFLELRPTSKPVLSPVGEHGDADEEDDET